MLDEAQRIKNWETKSAAYVKTLQARYRLVLTGTPMENRLEELASVLDWLDDVALAPKWRLAPWHTYSHGDGGSGTAGRGIWIRFVSVSSRSSCVACARRFSNSFRRARIRACPCR